MKRYFIAQIATSTKAISLLAWIGLASPTAFAHPICEIGNSSGETTIPECCREKIAKPPELVAIFFYSDSSEACRKLAPEINETMGNLKNSPVLWLTFDFSTTETASQAEFLAKTAGLEEAWNSFAYQSGYVLLLNGTDRKPVSKITRFYDAPAMKQEVLKQLTAIKPLAAASP